MLGVRKNTINAGTSLSSLPDIRKEGRHPTDEKGQPKKIKDFEDKLEQHQVEIERNNEIIDKLSQSFELVKE
jgi:hypothetical protein